ncbi:hypothetical protein [Glycomyces paridis]|uniref:Uncharacterized protein n=1 Tax=Glycomyces paridis TaxID=2126555 RepID=A0A4S8PHT5_9ACTN|nr:hypothetical protein [Glycomyces paridis]THV30140.1 hypothetical protein E9998_07120 [Glycomyces paridis]
MPRRPPARVRAQQRRRLPDARRLRYYHPVQRIIPARKVFNIPGASGSLRAAIVRLEREHARLSYAAEAFRNWRRLAYGPLRHTFNPGCDWCEGPHNRDQLELLLHVLPKRSARELRRLLAPIDRAYLDRTFNNPMRDGPWWHRRC